MSVDPALPPPAHGEDVEDAAERYLALVRHAVKAAIKRLGRVADEHGGGTVALANTGARGVRIVFVARDGTFADAMVPTVAAAEEVCTTAGWEITGWNVETVSRIAPSKHDRLLMRGTGR